MNPLRTICFDILVFAPPGRPKIPVGVLLYPQDKTEVRWEIRSDWGQIADCDEAEVLAGTSAVFVELARGSGVCALIDFVELSLSNILQVNGPFVIQISDDFADVITNLFDAHVRNSSLDSTANR